MDRKVTKNRIAVFEERLKKDRLNQTTVKKYVADVAKLSEYLEGREVTQAELDGFKAWLIHEKKFKKRSANAYIASVRSFCGAMDWKDLTITAFPLEYQGRREKSVSSTDYRKLVECALQTGDYRMAMLVQTLCHVDIRYSELKCLTVEAVEKGSVEMARREHMLSMELPQELREALLCYIRMEGIPSGVVFRTAGGCVLDRSNAWRLLKQLASEAGIAEEKVKLSRLKMPEVPDYYPFYPLPRMEGRKEVS